MDDDTRTSRLIEATAAACGYLQQLPLDQLPPIYALRADDDPADGCSVELQLGDYGRNHAETVADLQTWRTALHGSLTAEPEGAGIERGRRWFVTAATQPYDVGASVAVWTLLYNVPAEVALPMLTADTSADAAHELVQAVLGEDTDEGGA